MIFEITDTEKVMTASIYNVEAETKDEAINKYINELAGSLHCIVSFIVDDENESITAIAKVDSIANEYDELNN